MHDTAGLMVHLFVFLLVLDYIDSHGICVSRKHISYLYVDIYIFLFTYTHTCSICTIRTCIVALLKAYGVFVLAIDSNQTTLFTTNWWSDHQGESSETAQIVAGYWHKTLT